MSVAAHLEDLRGSVSPLRAFTLASRLSGYHRIQSSRGIVDAARLVYDLLVEEGVEAKLNVVEGRLGLEERWTFWEPRGWALESLVVEKVSGPGFWEEVASTTRTHPLVAVAHSPPGEAVGEAKVVPRAADYPGGGIAVVLEYSSGDYLLLEERGVEGIVLTHTGPGIRYYGLFPPPFRREPRAPAASLPYSKALGLSGERVRITSTTEYTRPTTPIVHAVVGEADGPGIVFVAHICHPTPGSHDNASGVAAVVEALLLLRRAEAALKEKGLSVHALLVPEYTGTAAAIDRGIIDPGNIIAAVSVDMVGSRLDVTGGVFNLYTSIAALPSPLDPLLHRALWGAYSELRAFDAGRYPRAGLHILGYSGGSDHDVTLSAGIPSSLLNEWPDTYYHTSEDTPEKLDPHSLASTALAIAAAALSFPTETGRAQELLEAWVKNIAQQLALDALAGLLPEWRREAYQELLRRGLEHSRARLEAVLQGKKEWRPAWEPDVHVARRGRVSASYLRLLGGEAGEKLLKTEGKTRRAYMGLVAVTLSATSSTEAARLELIAERGVRPEDELLKALLEVMEAPGHH